MDCYISEFLGIVFVVIILWRTLTIFSSNSEDWMYYCSCDHFLFALLAFITVNAALSLWSCRREDNSLDKLVLYFLYILQQGHTDWIFDLEWVDDEYCITGMWLCTFRIVNACTSCTFSIHKIYTFHLKFPKQASIWLSLFDCPCLNLLKARWLLVYKRYVVKKVLDELKFAFSIMCLQSVYILYMYFHQF